MDKGLMKIDQEQYVDEILKRFNMSDCNTRKTSMEPKPIMHLNMDPVPDKPQDYSETFPYTAALG